MLDNLERNQRLHDDKHDPFATVWSSTGLANTNPVATLGSTLSWGAPVILQGSVGVGKSSLVKRILELSTDPVFAVQAAEGFLLYDLYLRSAERAFVIQVKVADEKSKLKPAGRVVLFKKIMEDWGFNEQEAATLLGLEAPSDIRDIYDGRKPVVHRDANDRLRAILRIAADLDALYRAVRAIQDWLSEPQKDLGGATPRSLLQEGSMENLLTVKYYVSHLSGR
jgi:hypothetical protein